MSQSRRRQRSRSSRRWQEIDMDMRTPAAPPRVATYTVRQRTPPPPTLSIMPTPAPLTGNGNGTMKIEIDEFDLVLQPSSRVRKPVPEEAPNSPITNVWKYNLYEEMGKIRKLVATLYNFIALDTEFPGIIYKPMGTFKDKYEHYYESLRINVNLLKLIQLGLSFSDKDGNKPPGISAWQFNFQFDFDVDTCSSKSIALLEKAGLDFEKHKTKGIKPADFAELFISSGCILTEDVTWISFHSVYDFGYLIKALLGRELPKEEEFFEFLRLYFPSILDVKNLVQKSGIYHSGVGLQKLATELGVVRVGTEHQAGSDSWVTGSTFFKLQTVAFGGHIDVDRYNGIFGLERDATSRNTSESIAGDFRSKVQLSFEPGFAVTRARRTAPGSGSSMVHPEQSSNTSPTSELEYGMNVSNS